MAKLIMDVDDIDTVGTPNDGIVQLVMHTDQGQTVLLEGALPSEERAFRIRITKRDLRIMANSASGCN